MISSVTQIISLIYTYNEYLKTGNIPRGYLESGIFEECETVGYILVRNYVNRSGLDGELAAANPVRWFKLLEKEGCLKLSLHYRLFDSPNIKDNKAPQPVKGELYIEAIYKGYSNFWSNNWFKNKDSTGKDSWNVRYYLIYRFEDTINEKADLQKAKQQMRKVLQECISFATDNDFLSFANLFSMAYNTLDNLNPRVTFIKNDLVSNEAYPLLTRQVLYSALISFIFSNEEIWRIKFKKEEEVIMANSLAEEFYSALINSLIASVNSST
jgi:hypothetical protein